MADEDKPAHLRVVADNPEFKQNRARQRIEWPLRELTANLMRIARGAGRPVDLFGQCAAVIRTLGPYIEEYGDPADVHIRIMLSVETTMHLDKASYAMRHMGERAAVRGCLQMAASRLVGQSTQESIGHSELYEGARKISAANRMEMEQFRRPVPRGRRPRGKPKA